MKLRVLSPAIATFSILLFGAGSARAEGHRDPSAADALFQAAKDAMGKGDYATACPRFAESQRLDPAPGTLLNLAACEEKQGKLAASYAHFNEALETLPKDDYRVAYAREQSAALDKRLPKVTVKVAGNMSGVRVRRDGVELREGALGVALPVDPGAHVFVVEAPGREPAQSSVTVAEGESKTLELQPGDPARTAEASSTGSGRKVAAIASFAVGGAGIVTGAVTGLMFASAARTYDEHCDATGCDPRGIDAANRAKTFDIVSPVAFGVGLAGIGVGTYLLVTGKSSEAKRTGVRAAPQVGAGTAGISLGGTF